MGRGNVQRDAQSLRMDGMGLRFPLWETGSGLWTREGVFASGYDVGDVADRRQTRVCVRDGRAVRDGRSCVGDRACLRQRRPAFASETGVTALEMDVSPSETGGTHRCPLRGA